MRIAFTSLPGFVTIVLRGMPNVWRGRHRLLLCWLIFMQAVSPGRKTLEERARWTPATMTAWRFGRLRKATYGNVPLIVRWLAQDLVTTLPPQWHAVALWRRKSRRHTRHQKSRSAARAEQSTSSLVFWPALRPAEGSMGRLSPPRGLSAHSAQAP